MEKLMIIARKFYLVAIVGVIVLGYRILNSDSTVCDVQCGLWFFFFVTGNISFYVEKRHKEKK